jgi:hypothetical protein
MEYFNQKIDNLIAKKETMSIDIYIEKLKELEWECLIELAYDLSTKKKHIEKSLIDDVNKIIKE